MATSTLVLEATPRDIWSVLANASAYPRWVVGMREAHETEGLWPRPGSHFRGTVDWHGFTVGTTATLLTVVAPRHLAFSTRRRPFGMAHVDIRLNALDEGTKVELTETVVSPSAFKAIELALEPGIRKRNLEALRRLAHVTEASVKVRKAEPRSARR
jgi:uncharacterized protein YndB with AHSA1/START domain